MTSLRDELMNALEAEGEDIDLLDDNDPLSPLQEDFNNDNYQSFLYNTNPSYEGASRPEFETSVTSDLSFMDVSDSSEGSPETLICDDDETIFVSNKASTRASVLEPGTSPSQDHVLMPSPDTMTDFRTHGLVIDTSALYSPSQHESVYDYDVQVLPCGFLVPEENDNPTFCSDQERRDSVKRSTQKTLVKIPDSKKISPTSVKRKRDNDVGEDSYIDNETEISSHYDTFSSTCSDTLLLRQELDFIKGNSNTGGKGTFENSTEWRDANGAQNRRLFDPNFVETVQSANSGQALLSRTLQEVKQSLEDMSPTFVPSLGSSLGSVAKDNHLGSRYIKNLIVLSFGFMFIMIAFLSLRSLQSSMNHQQGIGLFSLSTIYGTFMIGCIFSKTIVRAFCPKWTILVSLLGLIMFTMANYYPTPCLLFPTSAILGLCLATLWTAQGVYITSIAITYAAAVGAKPEAVLNLFNGFFLTFCQLSQIIGNLISSSVFNMDAPGWFDMRDNGTFLWFNEHFSTFSEISPYQNSVANVSKAPFDAQKFCGARYCHMYNIEHASVKIREGVHILLITIFLGCIFVGMFIIATFMDRLDVIFHKSKIGVVQQLLSIFRLHGNHRLILLLALNLFLGMEEAFMYGEVTKAFITCPLGIHMIGYLMICYGACDAIGCVTCGRLQKYVGRSVLIGTGAVLTLSLLFIMLNWEPDPNKLSLFFMLVGGWGMADAVWQTQLCSLYGILFPKEHSEAAFASLRMYEAIGCSIAFAYGQFLCMNVKIYITGGVLVFGMFGYILLEITEKRRTEAIDSDADPVSV